AVMEQRGFLREQFRDFHPGGKLGAQLATVAQLMHGGAETPLVAHDSPMGEALIEMTNKGFGIACVMQDGALMGVISDGALRRSYDDLMARTAGEVTTRNPKPGPPGMLAAEAMRIMTENKIMALVVIDAARRPAGVLRIHDCLRAGVA